MKLPYDQIISAIKSQTDLSDADIDEKIKAKMDQLSGLISKEGAAHIIANELGLNLMEQAKKVELKIKDLQPSMQNANVAGKITAIYEAREFQKRDGGSGKVGSFMIADDTAKVRVTLWNDQTEKLKEFSMGMIVRINDALVKENNGFTELSATSRSTIETNPAGVSIEVAQPAVKRKKIEELQESDREVELLATVVQLFEPRFYEIDPKTGRRARPREDGKFVDGAGVEFSPEYGSVMNAVLDDGSDTIRSVFFRNQVVSFLGMQASEVLRFKDDPSSFQSVKEEKLGKIVKVVGRVSKNEMFDRLEFVAQSIEMSPNPSEELKKIEQQAQVIE